MSTFFNIIRFYRYISILLVLFVFASNTSVFAQKCTSTDDGQITNFLGTDFNRVKNDGMYNNSVAYPLNDASRVTPYSVRILPDGQPYEGANLIPFDEVFDRADISTYTDNPNSYILTDSLNTLFPNGRGKPLSWEDGTNSFFVTKGGTTPVNFANSPLCGLNFPGKYFVGRTVRFTYRVYFIEENVDKRCTYNSQYTTDASYHQVIVGLHGTDAYGAMNGWVTADGYETIYREGLPAGNGFHLVNNPTDANPELCLPTYEEIECDGYTYRVPDVNLGYTVTYEYTFPTYEKTYYGLWPSVQTTEFFAKNYRVVFDYINFSIEHICSDRDSICPGDEIGLTAVDFPVGTDVVWEYSVNDEDHFTEFTRSTITEGNNQVFFPAELTKTLKPGDHVYFRTNKELVDGADKMKYSILIQVGVSDPKYCAPDKPEISIDGTVCADNAGSAKKVTISNAAAGAIYTWTLLDPSNVDVTDLYLVFDDGDEKHAHAYIKPMVNVTEGEYTLKVIGRNGSIEEAVSQEATYPFYIYRKPELDFTLVDKAGEQATSLCPSALSNGLYTATLSTTNTTAYNLNNYTYSWTHATPVAGAPYNAIVTGGDKAIELCSGEAAGSLDVKVVVDNHGCSATYVKDMSVEKAVKPNIDCENWIIPTLDLSATAVDTVYTLALPNIIMQCGDDPTLVIKITAPDNTNVPFTLSADKKSITARFPLGKSTVSVTAIDGCGKEDNCTKFVEVRDVTPPNINCDLIPNYTTRLSYYDGCVAVPGEGAHPEALPLIQIPILEDRYHPGVMVEAIYGGRDGVTSVDKNAPYKAGQTVITWIFKDTPTAIQKSECSQKINVIDDKKPSVSCAMPAVLVLPADDNTCGATSTTILDRIKAALGTTPMPSATAGCNPAIQLTPKVFYIKEGDTEKELVDGVMFEVYKNYKFIWRFYNNDGVSSEFVDGTAFDDCTLNLVIKDKQAPSLTCTNLPVVTVTVNITAMPDKLEYDGYASARPEVGDGPGKTYSLKDKFTSIPSAVDACDGELLPVVYIDSSNMEGRVVYDFTNLNATEAKAEMIKALELFHFKANTTAYVSFVFTDKEGNKDSCKTQVTVVDRGAPVPDCWTVNTDELNADLNCEATTDLFAFDKLPTAVMNIITQTTSPSVGPRPATTTTQLDKYIVYPVKIVRSHYSLNAAKEFVLDGTMSCINDGAQTEVPLTQTKEPGPGGAVVVNTSTMLQTSNFTVAPECLNTTFDLGKTVITLYYASGQGDTSKCEATVEVTDVTGPTLVCGDFASDTVIIRRLPANKCNLTFAELNLVVPETPEQLGASDNCTPAAELELSYRRVSNGVPVNDLQATPYEIGTHTIAWVVTDNYGNASECVNEIEVKDVTGPELDCSNILPIVARGDCKASYDDVIKAGLVTPQAKNDACSPVGTDSYIEAVGTRDDGLALTEDYPRDRVTTITWVVKDAFGNESACTQTVSVFDTTAPLFNCKDLDTLHFIAVDACDLSLPEASFTAPVAKDSCTNDDVFGVGTRADGSSLAGVYPVGGTVIKWVFKNPTSATSKTCEQMVWVKTDKEMDARCGTAEYADLTDRVEDGNCEVDPAGIMAQITNHEALNPCNSSVVVTGEPSRSDGLAMNAAYPVGTTIITWTFTDKTNTLVNPVSRCTQKVVVSNENKPDVDCPNMFPDSVLHLTPADCELGFEKIPVLLTELPVNPCTGETATVDTARASGAAMKEPYKVGSETINWTFTFPSTGMQTVCSQHITVADTIAPYFDCSTLQPTIMVAVTSGTSVPYSSVVEAGFVVPTVTEDCDVVTTSAVRSDGKQLTEAYELGDIWVTFIFTDEHNNSSTCKQLVKIVDQIPPRVDCPTLTDNRFSCIGDTVSAYRTYAEFVAAGGRLEDEGKVDLNSFRHEDHIEGQGCLLTVTRDYMFTTTRGVVVHCEAPQVMMVNDDVAPTFVGLPASGNVAITSCAALDTVAPVITAIDNCDDAPVVTYTRVSTQGSDPGRCDYYTYDVILTYNAVDSCGNAATPFVYTIKVIDDEAPEVHEPETWSEIMHPDYRGNCLFAVPDITNLIPSDSIFQNCGDNMYLTYRQEPPAGTQVTASLDIQLIISDVCGNETVLTKHLEVQAKKTIVDVITRDYVPICADESAVNNPRSPQVKNSLSSNSIRTISGTVWAQDFDGTWWPVPTTVLWDCYRDYISPDKIVYSNNKRTYAALFADAQKNDAAGNAAYAKYNLLLRKNQTGTYFYVATDTVSGCSDTASVYIDVFEKPRVALASTEWNMCEGDSLTLNGPFGDAIDVCVNDMGSPITAEGWMVNGEVYQPNAVINYEGGAAHTAVYYAENMCGTTTSLNSLYLSCTPLPTAFDSLLAAGSPERYEQMYADQLHTSDSVKVNVFTHYDPSQILLTTNPHNKARIWEGDDAELIVTHPYEPIVLNWMRVVGEYDGAQGRVFDANGVVVNGRENDDVLLEKEPSELVTYKNRFILHAPADSAFYYVLVGNGVCPSVSSNVVAIDVAHQLPTAITPYSRDGLNDDFMRGHHVTIYNRYGQFLFEGNDGWDGTYRGLLADPGVYFYTVEMKSGAVFKGSIEVVKHD